MTWRLSLAARRSDVATVVVSLEEGATVAAFNEAALDLILRAPDGDGDEPSERGGGGDAVTSTRAEAGEDDDEANGSSKGDSTSPTLVQQRTLLGARLDDLLVVYEVSGDRGDGGDDDDDDKTDPAPGEPEAFSSRLCLALSAQPLEGSEGKSGRGEGSGVRLFDARLRHAPPSQTSWVIAVRAQVIPGTGSPRVAEVTLELAFGNRLELRPWYQYFFEHSLDLLCIADFDGYFLKLSPSWSNLLGYTDKELTGVPYVSFVHPDDVEATASVASSLEVGQTIFSFSNRYKTKSGDWVHLAWVANMDVEHGVVFATARDVSLEHKQREALQDHVRTIQAVATATGDGLLQCTLGGVVLTASPSFAHMVGHETTEAAAGQTLADLCIGADDIDLSDVEAIDGLVVSDVRLKRSGRVPVPVELAFTVLHSGGAADAAASDPLLRDTADNGGSGGGSNMHPELLVVVRDISDAKLSRLVDSVRAQSRRVMRLKDEFVATMSHEIRTPLNGVLGMLSVLTDSPIDDASRACVNEALASGGKLLSLLSDMVLFAEGRNGDGYEVFDLRRAVYECITDAERRYSRPGVAILAVFDKEIPRYIWTIPAAIRGCLSRLINNAFKFTTAGRITITVSTGFSGPSEMRGSGSSALFASAIGGSNHEGRSGVSSSNEFDELGQPSLNSVFRTPLTVRIRDTGIGVPEHAIGSTLFMPFSQEDSAISRAHGGLGLGLAIAKQEIESLGGTITAQSPAGPDVEISRSKDKRDGAGWETPLINHAAANNTGPGGAGTDFFVRFEASEPSGDSLSAASGGEAAAPTVLLVAGNSTVTSATAVGAGVTRSDVSSIGLSNISLGGGCGDDDGRAGDQSKAPAREVTGSSESSYAASFSPVTAAIAAQGAKVVSVPHGPQSITEVLGLADAHPTLRVVVVDMDTTKERRALLQTISTLPSLAGMTLVALVPDKEARSVAKSVGKSAHREVMVVQSPVDPGEIRAVIDKAWHPPKAPRSSSKAHVESAPRSSGGGRVVDTSPKGARMMMPSRASRGSPQLEPEESDLPRRSSEQDESDERPNNAGAHVIVVDDDLTSLETVAKMVRAMGFSSHETTGVDDAIKALEKVPPDASVTALVEMNLSMGSGRVVAKTLRSFRPSLRVVALTSTPERLSQKSDTFWDAAVVKPIMSSALESVLKVLPVVVGGSALPGTQLPALLATQQSQSFPTSDDKESDEATSEVSPLPKRRPPFLSVTPLPSRANAQMTEHTALTVSSPALLSATGHPKPMGTASAEGAEAKKKGQNFLVVDDTPMNLKVMRKMLERCGHTVSTATDGLEGFQAVVSAAAKGEPFDGVWLDLHMPVLDGFASARAMRAAGVAVPICAVTADLRGAAREKALETGIDLFITKPISVNMVERMVEALGEVATRRRRHH